MLSTKTCELRPFVDADNKSVKPLVLDVEASSVPPVMNKLLAVTKAAHLLAFVDMFFTLWALFTIARLPFSFTFHFLCERIAAAIAAVTIFLFVFHLESARRLVLATRRLDRQFVRMRLHLVAFCCLAFFITGVGVFATKDNSTVKMLVNNSYIVVVRPMTYFEEELFGWIWGPKTTKVAYSCFFAAVYHLLQLKILSVFANTLKNLPEPKIVHIRYI